jgi:predicted metalloprotease
MKWEDERESGNVEDARGFSIGGRGAGIGCGGLIVVLLVSWITGINPARLLNLVQQSPSAAPPPAQTGPAPAPGDRL